MLKALFLANLIGAGLQSGDLRLYQCEKLDRRRKIKSHVRWLQALGESGRARMPLPGNNGTALDRLRISGVNRSGGKTPAAFYFLEWLARPEKSLLYK